MPAPARSRGHRLAAYARCSADTSAGGGRWLAYPAGQLEQHVAMNPLSVCVLLWASAAGAQSELAEAALRQVVTAVEQGGSVAKVRRIAGTGSMHRATARRDYRGSIEVAWRFSGSRPPRLSLRWWGPDTRRDLDEFVDGDGDAGPEGRAQGELMVGSDAIWRWRSTLRGVALPPEQTPPSLRFAGCGGRVVFLKLDAATHLPSAMRVYERAKPGGTKRREVFRAIFGDYGESDGLILPHSYQFYYCGRLVETWALDAISVEYEARTPAETTSDPEPCCSKDEVGAGPSVSQ
jgi:hypothetical protein